MIDQSKATIKEKQSNQLALPQQGDHKARQDSTFFRRNAKSILTELFLLQPDGSFIMANLNFLRPYKNLLIDQENKNFGIFFYLFIFIFILTLNCLLCVLIGITLSR